MGDIVTEHRNAEGERISIQRVQRGEFYGSLVLVIHDDPDQGDTEAPMLLDEGTREWLKKWMEQLIE